VFWVLRTLSAWFCGAVFNEICVEQMGFLAFLLIFMGLSITEITYFLLSFRFCLLYTLRLCWVEKNTIFVDLEILNE